MAFKQFNLDGIGPLTVYKRRGSRTMRLSVTSDGKIRVTIPSYAPYQTGLAFAHSKRTWLQAQSSQRSYSLENGQEIGKHHRLILSVNFQAEKPTTRVTNTEVRVSYPAGIDASDQVVQSAAIKASTKALRNEAEAQLPSRLAAIAERHEFSYKSVSIKQLKGRWGSCDQDKRIVLNLYLMQLPWELIDYVLLHELIHTRHLNHGPDFWDSFLKHEPKAKQLRKQIRRYQPNFNVMQALK
ncbi:M48 family metallopeptidase [Candidatus Saccharibacteria bacterium]|nr:M48 family metallopeptidase [Candidatus Saccharibacteria bacterium]